MTTTKIRFARTAKNKPVGLFYIIARISIAAAVAGGLTVFSGCKKSEPEKPAPAVTVAVPVEQDVVEWDEYPARLESPETATVAARVGGLIVGAPFEEGALVNKGDLLFVIDDRPFKADLDAKLADVARAKAAWAEASAKFERYQLVRGTKAISAQDFDQAQAALKQTEAQVAVAKAATEISSLSLEWTRVTAPISGRIGRKLVTVGNLIAGGAGQTTALTTITSVDPIYCYANISERDYLKYRALKKKQTGAAPAQVPAAIGLENEAGFPHKGRLDFIDNRVDPALGTMQIRGIIPNRDGALTPGLFVRMQIPGSEKYRALLVPDSAVGTDQASRFLLIVGADDTVEARPVKIGALFGDLRAITDGLKTGERVVINGLQAARPKTKVAPTSAGFSLESFHQASGIEALVSAAPPEQAAVQAETLTAK